MTRSIRATSELSQTQTLISQARQITADIVGVCRADPRLLLPRLLLDVYQIPNELIRRGEVNWPAHLDAVLASDFWQQSARKPWPTDVEQSLDRLSIAEVSADVARIFHERRHYLGTFREGVHLGLAADGTDEPISLATFCELDVASVIQRLPENTTPAQVLMLARLCANNHAPPNILSYTLGRAFSWLRARRPDIRLLVTYLDPNLGFSGAIYRATNWTLLLREEKLSYVYLDGVYVTARELHAQFGTYEWHKLSRMLGGRIVRSTVPLEPLQAFEYGLIR